MSLAPAERRALAQIEEALRRSDPRLASMLTQFRLPLLRGGRKDLPRRLPRIGSFLPPIVAVTVVFLFVLAIMLSPDAKLPCGVRGGLGSAAADVQVSSCSPTTYRGHAGVATESGLPASAPGNRDAP